MQLNENNIDKSTKLENKEELKNTKNNLEETLENKLLDNPFFSNLKSKEKLKKYLKNIRLKEYPAGSKIIEENTNIDFLFISENGKFLITRNNKKLAEISGAGILFGEMSFFYNMPTTANVIAENNSKLWVISRKDFKELIDNIPELKEKIKDILKKRIQENKKKDPNFPLSDLPEILK